MKKNYLLMCGLLATMCANAQVWDGTSAAWTKGDGTASSPYQIENGQNLAYLAEQVRAGETYEGKYFILTSDIDMGASENHKFTPIGFFDEYVDTENGNMLVDESKYFKGTFDGNYKTIDNVDIYFVDTQNEVGGTGLFACITDGAVVKNLTIGANSKVEGSFATGAIVGATTGGRIENCMNSASFSIPDGAMGTGGIVGALYGGTISGCVNTADYKGANNVGGIVGFVDRNGVVENCYNTGDVSFSGFYAGGIVGYLSVGTCTSSYNIGSVLNDFSGSAVVGTTDNTAVIENCYYLTLPDGATDENNGTAAKTESEMKEDAFLTALNGDKSVWVADAQNINNGFPILSWQADVTSSVSKTELKDVEAYVDGNSLYVQAEDGSEVTVVDMAGHVVAKTTANGQAINLAGKGVYIVAVSNGTSSKSFKVAVK